MRKRLNILFSTTRTWNCGDDFILTGVLRLLNKVGICYNPIIYNRNPVICCNLAYSGRSVKIKDSDSVITTNLGHLLSQFLPASDNSWQSRHGLDKIDYCILAGTPEWVGKMVEPLTEALHNTHIPIAYLGIGIFEEHTQISFEQLPKCDKHILQRAKIVTVRDKACQQFLKQHASAQLLPCPALFAAPRATKRKRLKTISISPQAYTKGARQPISEAIAQWMMQLIKLLQAKYDCALVLHYIDEVQLYQSLLPNIPIYYSYDPVDYLTYYDQFDLNITTRVHGAGVCASLGIPSFVINHSARSQTAEGFLSELININETTPAACVAAIDQFNISKRSRHLIQHKKKSMQQYLQLLRRFFSDAQTTQEDTQTTRMPATAALLPGDQ